MTSTEFAAKYRLLKNVATRGARSFLAQQVELGRMVMVHYLDAEDVEERATTLARLRSLQPSNRNKLLEIAEVDGTPVAVTLFISSFKDFGTWLDSVSAPAAAPAKPHTSAPATGQPGSAPAAPAPGEFTRAFSLAEPAPNDSVMPAAVSEPAAKPEPVKKTPGEFTRIFGRVDESTLPSTSKAPPTGSSRPKRNEDEIPTVIMEAVKRPQVAPAHAAPPPVAKLEQSPPVAPPLASPIAPPAPAPASPDSGSSFTAIFGSLGDASRAAPELPPPLATPASFGAPAPVMPPVVPPMDLRPTGPAPAPQAPAPSQPGEFTQLFQRLSSSGGSTPAAPQGAAPFLGPDIQRPLEPTPRADAAPATLPPLPPLTAPSTGGVGAVLPPMLGVTAPPTTPKLPDTPPPAPNVNGLPGLGPVVQPTANGAGAAPRSWAPPTPPPIGASVFGNSGPSEFTRILSPIAPPPPPPVSIQPPAAAAAAATGAAGSRKSMLPLIIGLAVVVVLTIVMVVYFVLRK